MVLNMALSVNIFYFLQNSQGDFNVLSEWRTTDQQMGRSKSIWDNEVWDETCLWFWGEHPPYCWKFTLESTISHLLNKNKEAFCLDASGGHFIATKEAMGCRGKQRDGEPWSHHHWSLPTFHMWANKLSPYGNCQTNKALPVPAVVRVKWEIPCAMLNMALHVDRCELRGQGGESRWIRLHCAEEAPGALHCRTWAFGQCIAGTC